MTRKKLIIPAYIFFSILLIILLTSSYIFIQVKTKYNSDFKSFITHEHPDLFYKSISLLKKITIENSSKVKRSTIPSFELMFSKKTRKHFIQLYENYENLDSGGIYYTNNNKWEKATLIFNSIEYPIKIKSHGKSPNYHRSGNFISYKIKLPEDRTIYNTNSFRLIINERIMAQSEKINDIANRFGLLSNKGKLIKMSINNGKEKLYFFEHRFDDSYMKIIQKPSYMIIEDEIEACKSFIQNHTAFDSIVYSNRIYTAISKKGYSLEEKNQIAKNYTALNKAISINNYKDIIQYFDFEYITSYLAAASISGFIGHGFTNSNLVVFYNKEDQKFYPTFDRDNFFSLLTPTPSFEEQISSYHPTGTNEHLYYYLFSTLFQNDTIKIATYHKIYDFIQKDNGKITAHHEEIRAKAESFYYLYQILDMIGLKTNKIVFSNNMQILEKQIRKTYPTIENNNSLNN